MEENKGTESGSNTSKLASLCKTYALLAYGFFTTGFTAYLVYNNVDADRLSTMRPFQICAFFIALFLMCNVGRFASMRNRCLSLLCYTAFTCIHGYVLSGILISSKVVPTICSISITTGIFLVASVIGMIVRKDLSEYSSILYGAVVAVIVALAVNIILQHPWLNVFISCFAVPTFATLVFYDTDKILIKKENEGDCIVEYILATGLYWDVLNLFLHVLILRSI